MYTSIELIALTLFRSAWEYCGILVRVLKLNDSSNTLILLRQFYIKGQKSLSYVTLGSKH